MTSVILTSSFLLFASAVSVTNHAGRVVTGEFGGVTNGTFLVNGKAYPLSILPKDEQLRVKMLAGCDVRTAKEKRLDRAREMQLERIRLREAEGEIDKVTADRLRAEVGGRVPENPEASAAIAPACRAFEAKCKDGSATRGDLLALKRFIAASAVDAAAKSNLTDRARREYQEMRKRK